MSYQIVDYSEKAIAVFFDPPRDATLKGYDILLTNLGGKVNPSLRDTDGNRKEGWIFGKGKRAAVTSALQAHSSSGGGSASTQQSAVAVGIKRTAFSTTSSTSAADFSSLLARIEALEMELGAFKRLYEAQTGTKVSATATAATASSKRGNGKKVEIDDEMFELSSDEEAPTTTTPSLIRRK